MSCKFYRKGLPEGQDIIKGAIPLSLRREVYMGERNRLSRHTSFHKPIHVFIIQSIMVVQQVGNTYSVIHYNSWVSRERSLKILATISVKALLFILSVWWTYSPSGWLAFPPPEERNPSTMSTTSSVSRRRSGVRSS